MWPSHPAHQVPSWSSYLALEELLRPQELVGEDPVSRGAAAWGLVALCPWQRGERTTVTGVLEQRAMPRGTAVPKAPWSWDIPHLLGRSTAHCVALIPKGVAGGHHRRRAAAGGEEE